MVGEDKLEVPQLVDKLHKLQPQQLQLSPQKQPLRRLIMMLNYKNSMLQIRLN